ncbi:MAG TPA: hypothetical protein VFZ31_05310 [Vicinamibacterales bacterium]
MKTVPDAPLGLVRGLIADIGAVFIGVLIRIFGRVVHESSEPWLSGPTGGGYIGDKPYEEIAARENLELVRRASSGGLLSDFGALDGPGCAIARLQPAVRHFYEHTARYRMDIWSETYFPGSIGLWLLVTTISRKFGQLNFPLRALAAAKGIDSEIVLLKDRNGEVRYTGWYRRLMEMGRTIYTGFYMTARVPHCETPCVKVVFPMPNGNATVILRPSIDPSGRLVLSSNGSRFGDAGFYRIDRVDQDRLRVWRVSTLREEFRVYVDEDGVLRCDHSIGFLGLPVLHLHYRIEQRRDV